VDDCQKGAPALRAYVGHMEYFCKFFKQLVQRKMRAALTHPASKLFPKQVSGRMLLHVWHLLEYSSKDEI